MIQQVLMSRDLFVFKTRFSSTVLWLRVSGTEISWTVTTNMDMKAPNYTVSCQQTVQNMHVSAAALEPNEAIRDSEVDNMELQLLLKTESC